MWLPHAVVTTECGTAAQSAAGCSATQAWVYMVVWGSRASYAKGNGTFLAGRAKSTSVLSGLLPHQQPFSLHLLQHCSTTTKYSGSILIGQTKTAVICVVALVSGP